MSNSINFNLANFTFSAEQIRDINELVYEGIEKLPELSAIHQFYRGIIYDKEVGFITGGGLVGKKGQGCDPQTQDWRVSTRKVLWQPKEWEIFLDECADDLKNTMVLYAMNQGTRVDDLTDTDYMAIVVEVLIGAVYKFIYRLIWMSDTNADNVDFETLNVAALATLTAVPTATATEQTTGSPLVGDVYEVSTADDKVKCALANGTIVYLNNEAATGVAQEGKTYYSKDTENTVTINGGGYITEDVDPEYFDIIDGLFKQLRGLVAEDNTRGVTITANSKTSKADQMGEMTADRAYTLLSDMWYKAPIKLRQMKADTNVENRPKFLVTQSIADAYEQYLIGKGIDRTYVNLVEGVQVLSFLGVPVVPMAIWDEMIQAYNDLGDTYFKPHRALLTTKSVLAVGTPNGDREFGEFDIWYDKTSRKNYILLKDKLDAKIANPDHFIYAE